VFDFEGDEGWTVESGDVWAAPSFRAAPVHRHGKGFLGTAENAEGKRAPKQQGTLRSPEFVVDHRYLVLRAGVSGESKHCWVSVDRPDGGRELHEFRPKEPRMLTHIWDARKLRGESIVLRLVDDESDTPCSIHIDWVRLVDG
jgi:hypothetical protein